MNVTKLGMTFAVLASMLASQAALADSTYGYSAAGTGSVSATAKVNLKVTVAKMILLRVGSTTAAGDTAAWTVARTIPGGPASLVDGNGTAATWDGTAPGVAVSANPAAFSVFAWTNATTPTIDCAMGTWTGPASGPVNANFTVTVTGSLPHPGANLGACAPVAFTPNTLVTGSWQYALGGSPATWPAGVYTNTITYTATGI